MRNFATLNCSALVWNLLLYFNVKISKYQKLAQLICRIRRGDCSELLISNGTGAIDGPELAHLRGSRKTGFHTLKVLSKFDYRFRKSFPDICSNDVG